MVNRPHRLLFLVIAAAIGAGGCGPDPGSRVRRGDDLDDAESLDNGIRRVPTRVDDGEMNVKSGSPASYTAPAAAT